MNTKTTNLLTFFATAIATLVTSNSGHAQNYYRQINYKFVGTQSNSTREVCVRRVLGQCVQWRTETNNRTVATWDRQTERNAIQALDLLAHRFLRRDVVHCALDNAQKSFQTGSPFNIPSYNDFRNYVRGQWTALFNKGMPHVTVQINRLEYPRRGQANVGNYVDARAFEGGTSVNGKYHFELDEHFLRQGDINQIAGVMAHEMLHQMTHSHPNGYEDENFVVAYQNCFVNNGRYNSPGMSLHGSNMITPVRAD